MSIRIPGLMALALAFAVPAWAAETPKHATYSKNEIVQKIEDFFGEGAEGLGDIVEKAFAEQGEPNAYIAGDELAATLGVGVRYGKGTLLTATGHEQPIYWQGPSIGFDAGANASKVFMLIYQLPEPAAILKRHPGVEGSLYFVGGVGMNYLRAGDTVIAPIRFGAGWRQGVSAGYLDFTEQASVNPF